MTDTHGSDREPSGEQDPAGSPAAPPPSYPQPAQPPQPPQYAPQPPPYGQPPAQVYGVPPAGPTPPGHYPYGQQPYGQYAPHLQAQPGYGPPGYGMPDPDKRPGTVLAAGIVSLVLSGITLLFAGAMLVALVAARADFIAGFTGETGLDNTDDGSLFAGILIVLSVMAFWCAAAIVLAILAMRRLQWARITLVVSSGATILISLIAITGGASAITLLGAIAVIVLLFTGGANEWYRNRKDVDPALPSY